MNNILLNSLLLLFICNSFHSINSVRIDIRDSEGHFKNDSSIQVLWFDQRLDHFDATNLKTWKQRYFVNDAFYKKGGPIFLMIGGEGEANIKWMSSGEAYNLAKEFGALYFMVEHRYYGKSRPTQNMSTENLRWLSSEQALADLASFRVAMATTRELGDAPWVAFGGSYPGGLAVWFRLKYPHLVNVAVSSSAPLVAVMNFKEYLGVVRDSIDTVDTKCNANIASAVNQLTSWINAGQNLTSIKEWYNLCDDMDPKSVLSVQNFFENLGDNVGEIIQYNRDNRHVVDEYNGWNLTMDTLCNTMGDSKLGAPVQRLGSVIRSILTSHNVKCFDFKYDSYVAQMKNVSWSSKRADERSWVYQTCTEFGYFQTSDLPDQPFGHSFPLSIFLSICKDVYGPPFTEALLAAGINLTNTNYGGKGVKVTRVIFINGSIDPWHWLGLTSGRTKENVIIFIAGTAHCANMYPESPDDLKQLKEARQVIRATLHSWLDHK